jgi:hypothetical protein
MDYKQTSLCRAVDLNLLKLFLIKGTSIIGMNFPSLKVEIISI